VFVTIQLPTFLSMQFLECGIHYEFIVNNSQTTTSTFHKVVQQQ